MKVEDKGDYWEVDDGTWQISKIGFITIRNFEYAPSPPFIFDLRDSLMAGLLG